MPLLRLALILLSLLSLTAPARAEKPVDPAALDKWWRAAARLWLGDTGYRAKGTSFEDGVCKATFDDGVFIPVWSGQPPVSERIVGVVFVGSGTLSVRFPSRADAWSFSAHRTWQGQPKAEVDAVARQEKPFEAKISRALLLSADPKVLNVLLDLLPIKSGSMLSEGEEGIDEVFMVTEERGKFAATVVANNVLPNRRRLLERSGLDVVAMVRQDRLLSEELGMPAEDLRLVADFRTDTRFGVAALDGGTFGPEDYDEWLTCFRDGLGQADTGFQSMAFAHGVDVDGLRHFMRVSGETFSREPGSPGPEPARYMAPVFAETAVNLIPTTFGNVQRVEVKSTLTLEARGGPLQHVTLRLPTAGSVEGTFEITALKTLDGRALAWSGLSADLKGLASGPTRAPRATSTAQAAESGLSGVEVSTSTSASTAPETSAETEVSDTSSQSPAEGQIQQRDLAESEEDMVQKTATKVEIIVLLPEAVPEGGQVRLQLDWKATWPYANWSTAGRPLGPTTGLQEILPELVPALGGTAWDFTTRLTLPMAGFRTFGVAVSGDTVQDVTNDEDGWRTVEASGKAARRPAVAIGRWYEHDEPANKGLPAVRVSLFTTEAWALEQFPPELRRVVSFLDRFLPSFPLQEIEVFQGRDTFVATAMRGQLRQNAYGLVGIQQVTYGDVGGGTAVEAEDPRFTQTMIARQVAGQVWGQLVAPATSRDAWILDALSDAYAAFYVRAAFGLDDYDQRVVAVRESIERPVERDYNYKQVARPDRPLSLTGSTPLSDLSGKLLSDYGFYVLAEMLRFRVGDRAFFLALDRLAKRRAGQRLTTEQLQEAFEETSEQDLSEFFDYWVHGGLVPRLGAKVRLVEGPGGTTVEGVLCSSVPFGTIEVPVVVKDKDRKAPREVVALIPVSEGKGNFRLEGREGKVSVELDPDGAILAYGRKVAVVDAEPRCE